LNESDNAPFFGECDRREPRERLELAHEVAWSA
jgi:cation transport regulator ChaB